MHLYIKPREGRETTITRVLNEVLRVLQDEGDINDEHDDGWSWYDVETIDRPEGVFYCPSCGSDKTQIAAATRVPDQLNEVTLYIECHAGNEECKLVAASADVVQYDG